MQEQNNKHKERRFEVDGETKRENINKKKRLKRKRKEKKGFRL
jgi:hypothetical protein